MIDFRQALEGLSKWRPEPAAPPPNQGTPRDTPPPVAESTPALRESEMATDLDALVHAAVEAVKHPTETVPLPIAPTAHPALEALRSDLASGLAKAAEEGVASADLLAIRSELDRHGYPDGFFQDELLPLLKPEGPGLDLRVLRVETARVVLVTPDGSENSLYHPSHNPGLEN